MLILAYYAIVFLSYAHVILEKDDGLLAVCCVCFWLSKWETKRVGPSQTT